MASPSAVTKNREVRFDGHTTPGGRTRMLMTSIIIAILMTLYYITKLIKAMHYQNNRWHTITRALLRLVRTMNVLCHSTII